MISYFFLGPLFLLAKRGTPLAEPYVRGHAMRASIIMLIGFLAYLGYAFLLRWWIDFSILTFHIHDIILTILSAVLLASLGRWAYRGYHSVTAESVEMRVDTSLFSSGSRESTYISSEEEKIRIIASMIPFVGIYLARRYPTREIIRARIIGSSLGMLVIAGSLVATEGSFLFSFTLIISILIFAIVSVHLFLKGEYISSWLLESLPSYEEIEAHIFASTASVIEFFRVAFGGEGRRDYHTLYTRELSLRPQAHVPTTAYFMPAPLIGIPFWNIFALPSLWIEKYREYREYVISGVIVTVSIAVIIYFSSSASPYLLLPLPCRPHDELCLIRSRSIYPWYPYHHATHQHGTIHTRKNRGWEQ
jgi:hypothetical protein